MDVVPARFLFDPLRKHYWIYGKSRHGKVKMQNIADFLNQLENCCIITDTSVIAYTPHTIDWLIFQDYGKDENTLICSDILELTSGNTLTFHMENGQNNTLNPDMKCVFLSENHPFYVYGDSVDGSFKASPLLAEIFLRRMVIINTDGREHLDRCIFLDLPMCHQFREVSPDDIDRGPLDCLQVDKEGEYLRAIDASDENLPSIVDIFRIYICKLSKILPDYILRQTWHLNVTALLIAKKLAGKWISHLQEIILKLCEVEMPCIYDERIRMLTECHKLIENGNRYQRYCIPVKSRVWGDWTPTSLPMFPGYEMDDLQ